MSSTGVAPQPSKYDYFKTYRSYREHEHNLLNQRLTWNLAIQGFLFAAFGFLPQLKDAALLEWVKHFLPWAGFFMSMAILCSVTGALIALLTLKKQWDRVPKDLLQPHLPSPVAAGSDLAFWLGFAPPLVIPLCCIILWISVLRGHY